MKTELVSKVSKLHKTLRELNELWTQLDWSEVPETVSENYPFHKDLGELANGVKHWLDEIKKA